MSEQDRRRRLAALRSPHWDFWREPTTPGTASCVACGALVITAGDALPISHTRSLPIAFRADHGKRSQPTEPRSVLVVCPGCHELNELRLKAA